MAKNKKKKAAKKKAAAKKAAVKSLPIPEVGTPEFDALAPFQKIFWALYHAPVDEWIPKTEILKATGVPATWKTYEEQMLAAGADTNIMQGDGQPYYRLDSRDGFDHYALTRSIKPAAVVKAAKKKTSLVTTTPDRFVVKVGISEAFASASRVATGESPAALHKNAIENNSDWHLRLGASYEKYEAQFKPTIDHDKVIPKGAWIDALLRLPHLDGYILVIESLEVVPVLRDAFGIDPKRVIFWTKEDSDSVKVKVARRIGAQVKTADEWNILEDEIDMQFGVILGNPPFSSGADHEGKVSSTDDLATQFYRRGLELREPGGAMGMVLPNTQNLWKEAHNQLIHDTASDIMFVSKEHEKQMRVSQPMWIVFVDDTGRKSDVEFVTHSVNNNFDWRNSRFIHSEVAECFTDVRENENDVLVHFRDPEGSDGFVDRYIPVDHVDRLEPTARQRANNPSSIYTFPKTGYAVLLNASTRETTGFHGVRIVELSDTVQMATMEVKVIVFDTRDQAERFVEVIRKPEVIADIWRVRKENQDDVKWFQMRAVNISKEDEDYIING